MLPPDPPTVAALASSQPPAIVRQETSDQWRAVVAGTPLAEIRLTAPDLVETVEYPEENLPIAVEVIADGLTPEGHWRQTVRLTIKPGGTLGHASHAVYGNMLHVDELFEAARKLNPALATPGFVPTGQSIELTIDPTRVYVLREVTADDAKLVRTFANGVRETIHRKPSSSVVRVVEFPRAPGYGAFSFPDRDGLVSVPSGGRIVDCVYKPGDDFPNLVRASLGTATFKAAVEVSRQTGWRPTSWPPPAGEAKRLILGPVESYLPDPFTPPEVRLPSQEAQAALERLTEERRRVGIYPARFLSSGTVYRVEVEDVAATARDVARLIYGDEQEHLAIAERAGFRVPGAAQDFNPKLFGTSFEVPVDYTREYFPYADEYNPTAQARVIRLLNGTVVERFDRAQTDGHGIWEITRYPNGFKRITYRPDSLTMELATGLAYVRGIQDVQLDDATGQALRRRYAAEFVWDWSLGVPRQPGDIADSFDVQEVGDVKVIVVSIGPSAPLTGVESLLVRLWNRSPLVKAVAAVVIGAAVVVVVGLLTRRVTRSGPET